MDEFDVFQQWTYIYTQQSQVIFLKYFLMEECLVLYNFKNSPKIAKCFEKDQKQVSL
jgi:hypothetical protein